MNITVWTEEETKYCLTRLKDWRNKNFREQEAFISELKITGNLAQEKAEIRLRFNYLDRLANGDFTNYELLTIPEIDKKFIGICKKN